MPGLEVIGGVDGVGGVFSLATCKTSQREATDRHTPGEHASGESRPPVDSHTPPTPQRCASSRGGVP